MDFNIDTDLLINESFSDDDEFILKKTEKKQFDSNEVLKLKVEAEEISQENQITELVSYKNVQKNLEYNLPHQKDGALKILRDLNCTALLADEVGLGKTITAGMVLKECIERGFVKKVLILTPPSLVDQWHAELQEKFELDFTIIEDEKTWEGSNLAIASIDRVKIFNKEEGKFKHKKAHEIVWDLLVVDEAHKLKDKKTIRWKFVDMIPKKRFLILTATPFQNDLVELYNLLHLLKRGHLGTMKEFRRKFLFKGNKRHPLNPQELRRKLEEVMVRRRRSETKVDYMKRIPQIIAVDLTSEEFEIYKDTCELLQKRYFYAGGNEINGRLIVYALLPKITSSSKSAMESLQNIIDNDKYHEKTKEFAGMILKKYKNLKKDSKIEKLTDLVTEIVTKNLGSKILIYTKHPTTAHYIAEKLAPLNLKVLEFIGGLDREEKTRIIKEFRNDTQVLISTETGCEGLNFQFCNNLINYDLPWNPMSVEQRIGRLDRIGQKKDMNIYSLATKGTMEERIVDLIINKMCCIGLVIGELPIILFNLGIDSKGSTGLSKVEEMIMNAFIDSKNNLSVFSKNIDRIENLIGRGVDDYMRTKERTTELLD